MGQTKIRSEQIESILKSQVSELVEVNENLLINGDLQVWQSGTTISNPASRDYLCDMCFINNNGSGATRVVSQGNFSPGQTEVPGNPDHFLKIADTVAGSDETYKILCFPVEGVAGSSGMDFAFSIYARSTGEETISIRLTQYFGSGGSSDVTTAFGSINLTAGWQKHTISGTAPSVSGKTIGTGSFYYVQFRLPLNSTIEIDIARAKLEYGSVATEGPVPDYQDTFNKCTLYFERIQGVAAAHLLASGLFFSSSTGDFAINYARKRVAPTLSVSSFNDFVIREVTGTLAISNITAKYVGKDRATFGVTVTGATPFSTCYFRANNSDAYIDLDARL